MLLGLLGVWYDDFFGAADRRRAARTTSTCKRFPAYLQQLTWRATASASTLDGDAGRLRRPAPIVWGEPGTNGQHAFYQLIHQGTKLIPCDFIGFAQPLNPLGDHHDLLMANLLRPDRGAGVRQDRRGGRGRGHARARWCRTASFEGNRPSNTILRRAADAARRSGKLVALYEHRVFTQGVDLGHQLLRPVGRRARQGAREAHRPRAAGDDEPTLEHDSSTNALIRRYRAQGGTLAHGFVVDSVNVSVLL